MQDLCIKLLSGDLSVVDEIFCYDSPEFERLLRASHQTMTLTCPDYTRLALQAGSVASPSTIVFAHGLRLTKDWHIYGEPAKYTPFQSCFAFSDVDVQLWTCDQLICALYSLYWANNNISLALLNTIRNRICYIVLSEGLDDSVFDNEEYFDILRDEIGTQRSPNVIFIGVCDALLSGLYQRLYFKPSPNLSQDSPYAEWTKKSLSGYNMEALSKHFQALSERRCVPSPLTRAYQVRMKNIAEPRPRQVLLSLNDSLLPSSAYDWKNGDDLDILFILACRVSSVGDLLANVVSFEPSLADISMISPGVWHTKQGDFRYLRGALSFIKHEIRGLNLTHL